MLDQDEGRVIVAYQKGIPLMLRQPFFAVGLRCNHVVMFNTDRERACSMR